jgi:flagellin-specific chaperone FliS
MGQNMSPLSAYTNALGTRPPLHVIVGLYDLAIVHISRAADAADRRDYELQFNEALKASQILNGLCCCLDLKRGGKVAESLRDLYQSVVSALLRSVGKRTAAIACLRLASAVRETRNAWAEIAKLPLTKDPVTITRTADPAPGDSGFTSQTQSVMNTSRQGRLTAAENNRKLEKIERPSDVTRGLSGKSPEARRRSVDLA